MAPWILIVGVLGSCLQDPPVDPVVEVEARVEALVIAQQVSGQPGRPDDELAYQQIALTSDRVLLEDPSRGLVSILRLDGDSPLLWEISADRKMYRENRDLGRIQKDRTVQEQQLVERSKELPEKQRDELLKASHIRLSSSGELIREIRVEETASEERRLGLPVRRVQVWENDRLIADLWVAAVQVPFPLARFHRASGAFGVEVQEALEKIEGLPLEGIIHVVTATLSHPINFTVKQWDRRSVPAHLFDIPEGCQKIEEKAFLHCPICGNEVEKDASAARARTRDGEWLFFDSRECFKQWRTAQKRN